MICVCVSSHQVPNFQQWSLEQASRTSALSTPSRSCPSRRHRQPPISYYPRSRQIYRPGRSSRGHWSSRGRETWRPGSGWRSSRRGLEQSRGGPWGGGSRSGEAQGPHRRTVPQLGGPLWGSPTCTETCLGSRPSAHPPWWALCGAAAAHREGGPSLPHSITRLWKEHRKWHCPFDEIKEDGSLGALWGKFEGYEDI